MHLPVPLGFLLLTLGMDFFFAGGIASLIGYQDWLGFIDMYVFLVAMTLMLYGLVEELEKKTGKILLAHLGEEVEGQCDNRQDREQYREHSPDGSPCGDVHISDGDKRDGDNDCGDQ